MFVNVCLEITFNSFPWNPNLNWLLSDIHLLCISHPNGEHELPVLVQMHAIIKRIHCFCIYSNKKQTPRSDKNARNEILKERIKENSIGHQTVAHKNRSTGNESTANTGKKEHQYIENFAYSRFLSNFNLLYWHRKFAWSFLSLEI